MSDPVKPRRAYNSPRRQEQAAATRRSILETARRLFEEQGYAATTMETIAAETGVAAKTVYLAFTTKSGLLRALWDLALKGDEDVTAVAERRWYLEVVQESDPRRQLRLNARNSRVVKERVTGIIKVIRAAAAADPDSGDLWALIQSDFYKNQRVIVESLLAKKALRRGLDAERATDILWSLNHPDLWLLLTGERHWSPEQWQKWFYETTVTLLLRP